MNKDTLPRVKVFSSYDSDELEELINNFIDELDKKHMEIKNIEYSSVLIGSNFNTCAKTTATCRYSALITYGLTDEEARIKNYLDDILKNSESRATEAIRGLKRMSIDYNDR